MYFQLIVVFVGFVSLSGANPVESDARALATPGEVVALSTAEQNEFVNKHVDYRKNVASGAANMEPISWDSGLATKAAGWASTCLFHHPHSNDADEAPYKTPGQNLYWTGASRSNKPTPTAITKNWHDEVADYTIGSNTCASGETCGHYIQIVYATTTKVGCGMAYCDSIDGNYGPGTPGWVIACDYSPGVTSGQPPYIVGDACSKCTSGIGYCKNKECVGSCSAGDSACTCEADCGEHGSVTSDCKCTCDGGYWGTYCDDVCENTHEYCRAPGSLPGFSQSQCQTSSYVRSKCPLYCGLCEAA